MACPAGQSWQAAAVDDPFWGLYAPALQRVHELQPLTFENVPAAQGAHTDAPEVGLLVPGLQGLQTARARASPYVPAAHGRHAVDELAPIEVLYVPRPHPMHDDEETEPVEGLKVPAAHSMQSGAGWPPGLYDPALQKPHSDAVLAPEL